MSENIKLYASLAVEDTLYSFDKLFDYEIPSGLKDFAKAGSRVKIPFGKGNRERVGIIFDIFEKSEDKSIKEIISVIDKEPVLSHEMILLAKWMQQRYFCTFFDAVKAMLPSGYRYKMRELYCGGDINDLSDEEKEILNFVNEKEREKSELIEKFSLDEKKLALLIKKSILKIRSEPYRPIGDATKRKVRALSFDDSALTPKQQLLYACLMELGEVSVKEACYYSSVSEAVLKALVKKGAAEMFDEEFFRNPYAGDYGECEAEIINLSAEQQKVYDSILSKYEGGCLKPALLYGVTGSGKTSVYLKLIDRVLSDNKGAIVMVPEISLTPQTAAIFRRRYGKRVAIFHSALSMGERLDEHKRVDSGQADIAIGTRSAVFAPIKNLGLIVIDEEQEYTYKSEMNPKFHTRDIARFRCSYHNAYMMLSSATPSIESMYFAKNNAYSLFCLENRYGKAKIPSVEIADMNEERLMGNSTQYSQGLISAITQRLEKKEQTILLLNRRGYNTFAICTACRNVVNCPRCSISLTFHSANNRLICHYCGYSIPIKEKCPVCNEEKLSYRGFGTQRAQEELSGFFPEAKILRIDTDAAMTRSSFENSMDAFRKGEYDILVGTQMVAKGLDFENVTLVGILSADQSLYADDFRSNERAFDLFTQVIGRAGRGALKGEAYIQTFTPESSVIAYAKEQNYDAFYDEEIKVRKLMLYPPFSDFCLVTFSGLIEREVRKCSEDFMLKLKELAEKEYNSLPLRVLNPSAANVAVINRRYRYRLLIKCRNSKEFREFLRKLLLLFLGNSKYKEINIGADINPDIII